MWYYQVFVLLMCTTAAICNNYSAEQVDHTSLNAPRPPKDKFRLMISNIDEQRVDDEIEDLTQYGCEKMVVIRNRAKDTISLTCNSYHDAHKKPAIVQPDNAFIFTFRPRKDGKSVFWCTVEYRQMFARFDVYNEALHYMCPRNIDEVYQYTITHDGVHVDEARNNGGLKIRALFKGHNKYILWEEFNNNQTDGFLYSGFVDGGMCSDVPEQFNDKTAAVTICHNQCVHLFEHYGCRGKVQTVQASDDCTDYGVHSEILGKLSAVQGC